MHDIIFDLSFKYIAVYLRYLMGYGNEMNQISITDNI